MTTIELVSVGSKSIVKTPRGAWFAQRQESKLNSDRGLFQKELDKFDGTIIHLGEGLDDPDGVAWFCINAIEFMEEYDCCYIRYVPEAFEELSVLLDLMQDASPTHHVILLTDTQGGPEEIEIKQLGTIQELADLNFAGEIRLNALYHIRDCSTD